MPHNRTPKPGSKYYLPKYKYRTVVNFCLQYHELKDELRSIDGWHSGNNDGMPHGTGTSDPVANDAIRRQEIQKKIDIIEESVRECVTGIYKPFQPYVMKSITTDYIGYHYLDTMFQINSSFEVPMTKNKFSELRRKVYYTISKKI